MKKLIVFLAICLFSCNQEQITANLKRSNLYFYKVTALGGDEISTGSITNKNWRSNQRNIPDATLIAYLIIDKVDTADFITIGTTQEFCSDSLILEQSQDFEVWKKLKTWHCGFPEGTERYFTFSYPKK